MFETFKLLNRLYKTEAKQGQILHKAITYGYYFLFEFFSLIFGRNNMKFFLRHVTRIAFLKMRLILKDGIIINHFLEAYSLIVDIIVLDEYDLKEIPKGKTIIDVGANIGLVTLLLSKRKEAKVYAFEASKENFELLLKNIEDNKCDNVIAAHKAVYKKNTKLKLFLRGTGTHSIFEGTGMYSKNKYQKYETVDAITLDSFGKLFENIYLIKIDVEGAEPDVLEGAKNLLSKTKKVYIEITKKENVKNILDMLAKHKFSVRKKDMLYFASKKD